MYRGHDGGKQLIIRLCSSVGELDGPATAVGTSRTITISKSAIIVERQTDREVTENKLSFSYAITNSDNPFQLKGYIGNVTVYPLSENENQCFWFVHGLGLGFVHDFIETFCTPSL